MMEDSGRVDGQTQTSGKSVERWPDYLKCSYTKKQLDEMYAEPNLRIYWQFGFQPGWSQEKKMETIKPPQLDLEVIFDSAFKVEVVDLTGDNEPKEIQRTDISEALNLWPHTALRITYRD